MTWLDKTPKALVLACIRMLRPLEAEERNNRAEEAGWGHSIRFKKDTVRRMQSEWMRESRVSQGTPLPRGREALRVHGIGQRKVPRRKARS